MNRTSSAAAPVGAPSRSRTAFAVGTLAVITLMHLFRVGAYLRGSLFTFYYSYVSDILVPFGMYFLLCLGERGAPRLAGWRKKALLVFGIGALSEVLQGLGVPLLGRTFDPLDFVMFAIGVGLAVVVDKVLLERRFPGRAPA